MEVSGLLHAPVVYPRGKSPGTHRVDPTAGLDAAAKRKEPTVHHRLAFMLTELPRLLQVTLNFQKRCSSLVRVLTLSNEQR
jgi:hypothetical protein